MARQTQQHPCSLKKSAPCPPAELCITSNITLSPLFTSVLGFVACIIQGCWHFPYQLTNIKKQTKNGFVWGFLNIWFVWVVLQTFCCYFAWCMTNVLKIFVVELSLDSVSFFCFVFCFSYETVHGWMSCPGTLWPVLDASSLLPRFLCWLPQQHVHPWGGVLPAASARWWPVLRWLGAPQELLYFWQRIWEWRGRSWRCCLWSRRWCVCSWRRGWLPPHRDELCVSATPTP